jgi:lipopolysaccharide export system protein LptA
MTKTFLKILFVSFLLFSFSHGFAQDKIQLKKSDKLTGKTIDGKSVREASGNVNLVQGNVVVYCDNAIQYIDDNWVELRGNVKMYQDTLSLFTSKAIYYGNEKKAICEGSVTLKDPNATLRANHGIYFFNDAKAIFKGDVIIVNPSYRITSDELTYMRNTEDSYPRGNVVVYTDSTVIKAENIDFLKRLGKTFAYDKVSIEKDSSIIYSDTLTDFKFEKKSIATGNVKILNLRNNLVVTGNYSENYQENKYAFVRGNARLTQIENDKDTLYIYSNILETFRTPPEKYKAKENVEIIRGTFLAKSDTAIFSKTSTKELEIISLFPRPVVWQDNLQLTADSVYAELINRKLSFVYAKKLEGMEGSKNSFLLVPNTDTTFSNRFDQITGKDIKIIFENDSLKSVEVYKNSTSIYFAYENLKANGVNFVNGENMFISFDSDKKVSKIRIDKFPKGQYIPEVKMNTVLLTLPGFILRNDKPIRK